MAKGNKAKRSAKCELVPPTEEQLANGAFAVEDVTDKRNGGGSITIGKAYRRRPMIKILLAQEALDQDEYRALAHYRHHADMADRSPIRDSLCLQRGGNGLGPSLAVLNAARVRDDCERAAGTLVDILRAVVVDDCTLSQWAIRTAGSIEECYERRGRVICQIKPRRSALDRAKLEIKMVARRIMAELDAWPRVVAA